MLREIKEFFLGEVKEAELAADPAGAVLSDIYDAVLVSRNFGTKPLDNADVLVVLTEALNTKDNSRREFEILCCIAELVRNLER